MAHRNAVEVTKHHLQKLAVGGFRFVYLENKYQYKHSTKRFEEVMDKVSEILTETYQETFALLNEHRNIIDTIARALYKKEILTWDELSEFVEKQKLS